MPERKYAKHVLPAPLMRVQSDGKNAPGYNFVSFYAHQGEMNTDFTLALHYMTEPYTEVYPHTHEGHEVLCFIGGNPEDFNDFDAEIELMLGEEEESYVINTPSVFSLPPGLVHGPLTFKKVNKPVFFIEVTSIPKGKYVIKPENEEDK